MLSDYRANPPKLPATVALHQHLRAFTGELHEADKMAPANASKKFTRELGQSLSFERMLPSRTSLPFRLSPEFFSHDRKCISLASRRGERDFRAHDTRPGRDVAIKVLPESFARDGDRPRRFEQEAQAVAALNQGARRECRHTNRHIFVWHGAARDGVWSAGVSTGHRGADDDGDSEGGAAGVKRDGAPGLAGDVEDYRPLPEKKGEQRFQSAKDLAFALEALKGTSTKSTATVAILEAKSVARDSGQMERHWSIRRS
jgi:hypothetical protein